MTPAYRPDNRPSAIVWRYFDEAFANGGYPNVSWALGSDWGMGMSFAPKTPEQYRAIATKRMIAIYGPKPER